MKLSNFLYTFAALLFSVNQSLAATAPETIEAAVHELEHNFHPFKIIYAILLTLLFFAILFIYNKITPSIDSFINKLCDKYITSLKYKKLELLSGSFLSEAIKVIIKVASIALFFAIFYLYLLIVFSFFPATQGIANALLSYVMSLLGFFYNSIISFIPNLFAILLIATITLLSLKALRFFAWALWSQRISFYGFHREWIYPTYNLLRFFTVLFAIVMIAPYLPGYESPSFKAVSVLLGVMVTLGSTSSIANVVAGIVLIYMRPFSIGDRVKIDDLIGDVVEMSLLVTRIKTTKNEHVTLPNSKVLGGSMIDYSSPAENKELVLYTSVTIGYDVPVNKVQDLLLESAKVDGVLDEPKSYVLVKGLENSYINYELNVYVDNAKNMPQTYSKLHESIYHCFTNAGVEILSAEYFCVKKDTKS